MLIGEQMTAFTWKAKPLLKVFDANHGLKLWPASAGLHLKHVLMSNNREITETVDELGDAGTLDALSEQRDQAEENDMDI